ncbi:MAG: hypothetical protein ACRDAM_15735 [Casimicrobium sp.]
MAVVRFAKEVSVLPGVLVANCLYLVRTGAGFDLYCSDSTGSVAHPLNVSAGGGGASAIISWVI